MLFIIAIWKWLIVSMYLIDSGMASMVRHQDLVFGNNDRDPYFKVTGQNWKSICLFLYHLLVVMIILLKDMGLSDHESPTRVLLVQKPRSDRSTTAD